LQIKNRKVHIVVSMVVYVFVILLLNLGNSVMPVFLKQTPFGTQIFGYLMGFMYLGQFLIAPFWGTLSDSRGRAVLALSPLGYGIGQLIYMFSANSFVLLVVSRVIAGAFAILFLSQFVAYISDISPVKSRQRILSLAAVMTPLGAGIAYLIGGLIKSPYFATWLTRMQHTLSFLGPELSEQLTQVHTFPFVLQFGLGIITAIFLHVFISRNNEYQVLNKEVSKGKTNPIARTIEQFNMFLAHKETIVFSLVTISFFNSIAYAATQSIQYYLQDGLNLDAQGIGLVVFAYNILSVLISLLVQGILLRTYSRWQNLVIANGTVIVFAALLFFANAYALIAIMSVIVMMNTLLVSIIQGTIADYSEKSRGVLLGMNQGAISLASILGNFIVSPLYGLNPAVFRHRLPFVMMAIVLSIVTGIILGPLKKQMKK